MKTADLLVMVLAGVFIAACGKDVSGTAINGEMGGTGMSAGETAGGSGGGTGPELGGASTADAGRGASGFQSAGQGEAGAAAGAGNGGTAGEGAAGPAENSSGAAAVDLTCLPIGEEELVIKITGQPSLDLGTPNTLTCQSRFLPPRDAEPAQLTLDWNTSDGTITVTLRQDDVAPGQLGTFAPFAVAIASSSDTWLGLPAKCHVTVSTNQKIDNDPRGNPPSTGIYKVGGSMACDPGWALGKENDTLDQFEFVTRVTSVTNP
jgi:hypothetical protein